MMEYHSLNGIRTFAFTGKNHVVKYVSDHRTILVAVNAEKIMCSEEKLRNLINEHTGYADGVGAVLALRKKGFKNAVKIPGVELWYELVKNFYISRSFFLIGSTREVICSTAEKLKKEFPGICIAGFHDGYLKEGDKEKLIEELKTLQPGIVFVAMGSPKQEFLMKELFDHHPAVYQGLGGSFDVYTNKVKRAPAFFVKLGLEWFYRLLKQPARIGRQLILVKFFWKLMIGKI